MFLIKGNVVNLIFFLIWLVFNLTTLNKVTEKSKKKLTFFFWSSRQKAYYEMFDLIKN